MKKKSLITLLMGAMLLSAIGCGNTETGSTPSNNTEVETNVESEIESEESETPSIVPEKDAIKIEDIVWTVEEGIIDGDRYVIFGYTNNSEYTILDVELQFSQKEGTTLEQLVSTYNVMRERYEYTDEEMMDIYVTGYNRKRADPGETVTDSVCVVNNSYITLENIDQYNLMDPDTMSIAFLGKDGKIYTTYYDFKNQSYGASTEGGKKAFNWSDSDLAKMAPKPESEIVTIDWEDEDLFSFITYGSDKSEYERYVEACKSEGFTEIDYENDDNFSAFNADSYSIWVGYDALEENINVSVKIPEETETTEE